MINTGYVSKLWLIENNDLEGEKAIVEKVKILFPLHYDSGNRGCEAIAEGTINILGLEKNQYIALADKQYYDNETNLDCLVSYYIQKRSIYYKIRNFLYKVLRRLSRPEKKKKYSFRIKYKDFISTASQDDCIFITGGDMLCYENNIVNDITEYAHSRKNTIVLWGCSIGKENLTQEKIDALSKFNLITARESLTYNLLKKELKLNEVYLFPDPAFPLKAKKVELPDYFNNECVGINLSKFVGATRDHNSLFDRNIIALVDYLIEQTEYNVILIPHVFWEGQDDRIVCDSVKQIYKNVNRVHYLDTEKMNYCQIRYVISKCRFFIGARTHSMISAYAMQIPALALGYSIKSRGIAKDLNLPDYTVIDYRNLNTENDIKDCFLKLQQNEESIREVLKTKIPAYIRKAYDSKQAIDSLLSGKQR